MGSLCGMFRRDLYLLQPCAVHELTSMLVALCSRSRLTIAIFMTVRQWPPSTQDVSVLMLILSIVMTFFVGTPDGRGSHDEVGAKIAAQGKAWARDHVSNPCKSFATSRLLPICVSSGGERTWPPTVSEPAARPGVPDF